MKDSPLVSVLMTAYNREKFIGEAIESVLESSYANFELIIVDDCSSDNTAAIADEYQRKDHRVKVFINEKNLGDYPNRNRAASLASGKYLKYVDSDDTIYSHGLEFFVRAMETYPDAGLGICSQWAQLDVQFPVFIPIKDALRIHFFSRGFLNVGPTGVIIRKDIFDSLNGFSGKRMVGDTELWLSIACRYPMVITFPSLVFWRRHDGQEFFDGVKSGLYSEMTLRLLRELMSREECTLSKEEKESVLRYNAAITAKSLLKRMLLKQEFSKSFELSDDLQLKVRDYYDGIFRLNKIKI